MPVFCTVCACSVTSMHTHTHIISVSLMCQGRNPSVLSTGPNFSTRSGSGMFFDSAQGGKKTGISGKTLRSFWRWIMRTLQTLLAAEKMLETMEKAKRVLNNRSVWSASCHLTSSCSWYRYILFYYCKQILVWYITVTIINNNKY